MDRRYTTDDVAAMYATTVDNVRRWIRQGRLQAVNLATKKRPDYRITPEQLAQFEAGNTTGSRPASSVKVGAIPTS